MGLYACAQDQAKKRKWDSALESNWGRSIESAKYMQTKNPEASKNMKPVVGLEGPAAERVMKNYIEKSAQKQESSSGYDVVTIKK